MESRARACVFKKPKRLRTNYICFVKTNETKRQEGEWTRYEFYVGKKSDGYDKVAHNASLSEKVRNIALLVRAFSFSLSETTFAVTRKNNWEKRENQRKVDRQITCACVATFFPLLRSLTAHQANLHERYDVLCV